MRVVAFANVAIKPRLITVLKDIETIAKISEECRLDRTETSGPEKTLLPDAVPMPRLSIGNSMAPPHDCELKP